MNQDLELASGNRLPRVGLGLWKVEPRQTASLVTEAVASGYRHFDSACDYGNEAEAGEGFDRVLREGAVRREDLWVTSKLWNQFHRREHVRPALERTLRDLRLDYLDLYLIHFPVSLRYVPPETRYPPGWFDDPDADRPVMVPDPVPISETWEAMERLVDAGLVREIGVCNFGVSLLRDLLAYASRPPAMLQVEMHPYLAQEKLLRFCHESSIAVTAFSPLGAQSYFQLDMARQDESLLEQPAVMEIAGRHSRTPAQVVLRWGLQRGTAVVPKTSRPERLRENIALFDFELRDGEMDVISGLDRHRRFNDPGVFCEAAFHTFFPIYE